MSAVHKSSQKGLGRGIDTLLPQDFDRSLLVDESERVIKVPVEQLSANKDQPRKHFDKEAMDQLAQSIREHGILQPLIVTPSSQTDHYMIIAGERRWRAAEIASLKSVPVIVRTTKELEQQEIALVENVQRVDLSPLEQATSIERLHQQFNQSYAEIAKRLGKGNSTITNIVRLLRLPPEAAQALREGKISEGHARQVLSLEGMLDKQLELLAGIVTKGWSVRQAERFVLGVKKGGADDTKTAQSHVLTESPATKKLSKVIKAPVTIRRMAHGGKLEIGFKSDEDLERIIRNIEKR